MQSYVYVELNIDVEVVFHFPLDDQNNYLICPMQLYDFNLLFSAFALVGCPKRLSLGLGAWGRTSISTAY